MNSDVHERSVAASPDNAETAAINPAGIIRFKQRAAEVEIIWFKSESNWESQFSGSGTEFNSEDSRTVKMSLSYMGLDDTPVNTTETPGFSSLEGKFKSRDTLLLQMGVTRGSL
jgi:long-subunit fatty acid transport protein